MLLGLLKLWLYSFLGFLVICLIIPTDPPFTDATVYLNIKPPGKQDNTIYMPIKDRKLKKKIQGWVMENNYKKVLIVVPRFEFFIYYIYFIDNHILPSHNFKMGAKTQKWSPQILFYNYHQTLFEIFGFIYTNIKYYFLYFFSSLQKT